MKKYYLEIFIRDLKKLKEEVKLYKNDSQLWYIEKEIKNPAGNLVLHLLGNLNHFICSVLGNSGYIRNRDAEFADKNIPRDVLLSRIYNTIETVSAAFFLLNDDDLHKKYPVEAFGKKDMTIENMLLELAIHFNYHLGQVNYHRRLLS